MIKAVSQQRDMTLRHGLLDYPFSCTLLSIRASSHGEKLPGWAPGDVYVDEGPDMTTVGLMEPPGILYLFILFSRPFLKKRKSWCFP